MMDIASRTVFGPELEVRREALRFLERIRQSVGQVVSHVSSQDHGIK